MLCNGSWFGTAMIAENEFSLQLAGSVSGTFHGYLAKGYSYETCSLVILLHQLTATLRILHSDVIMTDAALWTENLL